MRHFKLTSESKINAFGVTLFRVELTVDCKWGKAGDKGGWVESEKNIHPSFDCEEKGVISGNAEISGNAVISGGVIRGDAVISGNAVISGGVIRGDAVISGNAEISGGEISGGEISGGVISGGVIRGGEISGGVIRGGEIRGGVIRGGEISGGVIRGGEWVKSPLQIQGTKHFVNESKKGYLQIGCKNFTFEYWKENFESIGKANNYTDKEIKEYSSYIDLAISLSKL